MIRLGGGRAFRQGGLGALVIVPLEGRIEFIVELAARVGRGCARFGEDLQDVRAALFGGGLQRAEARPALDGGRVEIGPVGEQQADAFRAPIVGGEDQGVQARVPVGVGIGPVFEQQADEFGAGSAAGFHEGGVTLIVHIVDPRPVGQQDRGGVRVLMIGRHQER